MAAISNPATAPRGSAPAWASTAVSQSAVTWPGSEISAGAGMPVTLRRAPAPNQAMTAQAAQSQNPNLTERWPDQLSQLRIVLSPA